MRAVYEKYFNKNLPHIWCAGCGNGIVMSAFARAIEKLGYDKNEVVCVSGIGCSSRLPGYLDFHTLHTAHGRALAFATGVKMSDPNLQVFVFMGDGDCAAIGGNHFIHACRRNMDITAITINNSTYGMTGGQFSPLTPTGKRATTAPYGSVDRAFDLCELAKGAGATFVARGDVWQAQKITDLIVAGAQHKGFASIEIIATCPTSFGRYNKIPKPADMLAYIKQNTVSAERAAKMKPEELADKQITGVLRREEAVEYTEGYQTLVDSLQKRGEK